MDISGSIHRLFLLSAFVVAMVLSWGMDVRAQQDGYGGGAGALPHITAWLEAEDARPAPGESVAIALVMQAEPGWHGYWRNPGDAGKPPELKWDVPAGVTVGPPQFPVPQPLVVSGLMNHVYEGRHALLMQVRVPEDAAPGSRFPLKLRANWLTCSDSLCVPEQADLALVLTVGNGAAEGLENRVIFDGYRRKLPQPLGGDAYYEQGEDGTIRLAIPYPRAASLQEPHFFPLAEGAQSYAAAQGVVRERDRLVLTLKGLPDIGGSLEGVLKIAPDRGLTVTARPGQVAMPDDRQGADAAGRQQVLLALGGAILGGLILNIMPCVFPILSLKAMSLIRSAASPAHAHHEAWAYTGGVMLTCMALGGAVLGLRAGGESIGWAFQLQNPAVILLLLALSVAIALNMAGMYRLAPLQLDGRLSTGHGLMGDFWSGVLVAFVATPCTGPFMATALGAALLLPVPAALAVFAGLGLGIALPFLLLAYVPALRRAMPRPGPWMERAQRWLAVPMALTAAALIWLLWRQAGGTGLTIGLQMVLALALMLWWLGRAQRGGRRGAGLIALALLAIVGAGSVYPLMHVRRTEQPVAANAFSEAALARARASGKPVFLYFTADWCLSCKVNEAGAIDRAEVRGAFERAGVRTLVGDWTNGDPDITRFLEAHGRTGVPLYLWYPTGGGEPKELPQILTPSLLVDLAEKP